MVCRWDTNLLTEIMYHITDLTTWLSFGLINKKIHTLSVKLLKIYEYMSSDYHGGYTEFRYVILPNHNHYQFRSRYNKFGKLVRKHCFKNHRYHGNQYYWHKSGVLLRVVRYRSD